MLDQFNRSEHVYTSPDFVGIIQDMAQFFDATPLHPVIPFERFHGTGVYAIYCLAQTGLYAKYHLVNRVNCTTPVYVGKAVPKGWRQARTIPESGAVSFELYNRLREHAHNLERAENLNYDDFRCRFMILEDKESDLIGTIEAALIRKYQPLWNTVVDGFGNHDPGKGRYNQAKSDWDVCHPGRKWADKCQGVASKRADIIESVSLYLEGLNHD
ncbi:MAG: Eco29kI family restriction endonuclease [Anaerolineales bacterium]|nr:Eco29kI family restriction endonuclease [Anaerolineales bacterium]